MWWTIPLVVIVFFIFIGLPLILEYRAEIKDSSIKENCNKKIIFIRQGEKIMKTGELIYARTHAEFLNQAFGTNYKAWMKCVWKYDENWIVWMVRFDKEDGGWTNTFISDSRIKEENLKHVRVWDGKPIKDVDKKKIVIQIEDLGYTRKYTCMGRYIYDEKNSDPYTVRYYDKYSD